MSRWQARSVARRGRAVSDPVVLRGELDLSGAIVLERALQDGLPHGGELVLDLREVTFIDSGGVRAILRYQSAALAAGRRLTLLGPQGPVRDVLARLGLLDRLAVLDKLPYEHTASAETQRPTSTGMPYERPGGASADRGSNAEQETEKASET